MAAVTPLACRRPELGRRRGADSALAAKTRYRQQDADCRFASMPDAGFELRFEQAQWAVTPGQSAVLYDGEVCLGGGVIASASA